MEGWGRKGGRQFVFKYRPKLIARKQLRYFRSRSTDKECVCSVEALSQRPALVELVFVWLPTSTLTWAFKLSSKQGAGGGGLSLYFKVIKCTLKCNTADFTKNMIMLTTEGAGGEVI